MEKQYHEALKMYAGQLTAYATNLLREKIITDAEHLVFVKGFTQLTKAIVELEPKEPTQDE